MINPIPVERIDKNLYNACACVPFLLIALVTRNRGYELTQSEEEYLAPLWEDLFIKYIPEMHLLKCTEEITLGTTIIGLVIKKFLAVKLLKTPDPEQE